MHGPHDVGGRDGLGPVVEVFKDPDQPAFRYPFEARLHALTGLSIASGAFNIDQQRATAEKMGWAEYTNSSYYEKWLYAVENLLQDKGILTREEIDERVRTQGPGENVAHPPRPESPGELGDRFLSVIWNGTPHDLETDVKPRFAPGDTIRVRNINVTEHIRLPTYLHRATGVVHWHHGAHHDPTASAHKQIDEPHHLYTVRFDKKELWGSEVADSQGDLHVYCDLFENYLEPTDA